MKYIIADPDESSNFELKRILDDYEELNFIGSFTTFEMAQKSIREESPDFVFIRVGKAGLNAYGLIREISDQKLLTKVIFTSSLGEYAVDAFECEVYGFLLLPYKIEKIKHLILRCIEKELKDDGASIKEKKER